MNCAAMGKKKKFSENRLQLLVDDDWLARVDAEAGRQGLTRSAFIRQVVAQELDKRERERKAQEEEE